MCVWLSIYHTADTPRLTSTANTLYENDAIKWASQDGMKYVCLLVSVNMISSVFAWSLWLW